MSPIVRALAGLVCAGGLAAGASACGSSSPPTTTTTSRAPSTTSSTAAPTTTSSSTTTTVASTACNHLSAAAGQSQGAAGTITGTVTLTNTGSTCIMNGYPGLTLYGAAGTPLTTTVIDGLSVSVGGAANSPPATVTLAANGVATFTYQFSDVPSGTETSCATSKTAGVLPPGATVPTAQFALAMAPCSNGTVRVSPVYTGG